MTDRFGLKRLSVRLIAKVTKEQILNQEFSVFVGNARPVKRARDYLYLITGRYCIPYGGYSVLELSFFTHNS